LPTWWAVMMQLPTETSVTVVPVTVQTGVVELVNVTANPEVAVAVRATVPAVSRVEPGPVKEIV
jgi:hypothetical protein